MVCVHALMGRDLIAEFFGPGFQTRDAVLLVLPFVCFYALIHVRLAPPEQAVDKGGQFPSVADTATSPPISRAVCDSTPPKPSRYGAAMWPAIRSGAVVCRERRSRAFGCSTAGMLPRTARQLSELRCR